MKTTMMAMVLAAVPAVAFAQQMPDMKELLNKELTPTAVTPTPTVTTVGAVEGPEPKFFLSGTYGFTLGGEFAPASGVEFSVAMHPVMHSYVSFDWNQDVAAGHGGVQAFNEFQSAFWGEDVRWSVPALSLMTGTKFIVPRGPARPYGLVGIGISNPKSKVTINGTDVTDASTRLDLPFSTTLAYEYGGGVLVPAGKAFVDVSYRYRMFQESDTHASTLMVGAGVRF